jgi:hypothetical protein
MPTYVRLYLTSKGKMSGTAQPAGAAMEKEFIDRAKAIREGILQLRDSL